MLKKTLLIFIGIMLWMVNVNAQKSIVKKADKEFDTYAYIDAREIYLKVVENGYDSPQILKKLGDTYYFNSDYTEAVKWYKKLLDKYPNQTEPIYYYRTAQTLKTVGEYQYSKKVMGFYAGLSASSRIAEIFMEDYPTLDSLADFQSKQFEVLNITESLSPSDFGPSYYGDKLVYASSSKQTKGKKIHNWSGLPYSDLFVAELNSEWKIIDPQPIKGEVNSPYHESTAAFSNDGNTMYFTRNNYIDGKKKRSKQKLVSLKIYRATKKNDGTWGNIIELPFNNDSYSVAHPALNPDETRLYFSSNMKGTRGNSDLWYVDLLDHKSYGTPVNLGPKINTEARETFPFISKANNLYFSSDGHLGLGGLDVFMISLKSEGKQGEVNNLKKPINTNMDDFGFIIDEEKQIGYFSSNRGTELDSVSDDIYRVWKSCGEIKMSGTVLDKNSESPIHGALVTLLDKDNNIIMETTTEVNGEYQFENPLECSTSYTVRAEHQKLDYEPSEEVIETPRGSGTLKVDLLLTLQDCLDTDLGCKLTLQPIYFDYGKHFIRKDAEVELAKILEALKQYPNLNIHIESHTDSRSSNQFNLRLSQRRAKSTQEWLIKNGIEQERLSAKGYGETQPLNNCSNGVDCLEEAHQQNRRSVFIISNELD